MREFHISDVLTITTGRLLSNRHVEGIYDILGHMTGEQLYTHQLGRASEACRPHLEKRYPMLAASDPVVSRQMEVLAYTIATYPKDVSHAILGCVSLIQASHQLPEMLEVDVIPPGEYEARNPIEELVSMMGGKP